MTFQAQRDALHAWAAGKGAAGLKAYRQQKNRLNIDGLPAWQDSDEAPLG